MTIQLVVALRIAGAVQAAGTQVTLSEALEADLIYQGKATRVGAAPNQSGLGVVVSANTDPLAGGISFSAGSFSDLGIGYVPLKSGAANADYNTKAIQGALNSYPYVVLVGEFVGQINKTLLVPSDRALDFNGRELYLASLSACNFIRNKYCQNALDPSLFAIGGSSVVVTEFGHTQVVGDEVYIENAQGNTSLNGWKTITAVTSTTWTFAGSGSALTNIAGNCLFTVRSNRILGSAFTRTSNYVTVNEPGHRREVCDHVYIGVGTLSDTSMAGQYEIERVVPGVSWTYASSGSNGTPTGSANLLGDYNISLLDMRFDGNKANNLPVPQGGSACPSWGVMFCNASRVYMDLTSSHNILGRSITCFNTSVFTSRLLRANSGREAIQFDSFCDRVCLGNVVGENTDDVMAWGITINAGSLAGYLATKSPSGLKDMGSLYVDSIQGASDTSLFKMYCGTGYSLGRVKVNSITGNGAVVIGDSGDVSTAGGNITSFEIGTLNNVPVKMSNGTGQAQITLGGKTGAVVAFTSGGDIKIGNFICNQANSSFSGSIVGSTFNSIVIDNWQQPTKTLTSNSILLNDGSVVQQLSVNGGQAGNGNGGAFLKSGNASVSVGKLNLSNFDYLCPDAVNRYGTLVDFQIGSTIGAANFNNVTCKNANRMFYVAGTQTVDVGMQNIILDNMQWGTFISSATANINVVFNGIKVRNGIVNTVFGWNSGSGGTGTIIRGVGVDGVPALQFVYANTGGYRFQLDCPDVAAGLDFAGTYITKNTPAVGDKIWNTNAGYGAGIGLYGRTSAAAWQKIF